MHNIISHALFPAAAAYKADDGSARFAMIETFDGHEATIWVGFDFPYSISDSVAFSVDHIGPIRGVITDCTADTVTLRVESVRRNAA